MTTTPSTIPTTTPIVWLASYPKSGNTWLRFLLYNILYGQPGGSIAVTQRIPDIHRSLPFDPPENGPLMIKTHFECTPSHPLLTQTARAVHIVRHPKDILLSALNYQRMTGVLSKRDTDLSYAAAFIKKGGDRKWKNHGMGTWANHTHSWSACDRFPVHTVRYEQLKGDTAGELGRILAFLAIEADAAQVEIAVQASSFDRLRALEVQEKSDRSKQSLRDRLFVGDPSAMRSGQRFMNTGKSGQSLAHIDPTLDAKFDAAFAEDLARFGY